MSSSSMPLKMAYGAFQSAPPMLRSLRSLADVLVLSSLLVYARMETIGEYVIGSKANVPPPVQTYRQRSPKSVVDA